ncbi:acyl-CoA dehydrogenase [Kitasatospora sp. GAS204B]|uniref:acyl-CoA dehydrogenase n=1 Tax=unclassified Kitasatospora TaxID=2633591 RepID=UPI0024738931|nr:acyl-CoA dehydrogenase [Kitasatospora sp. GAS204B]MDH6120742.1 alkylation response protein AidB-like acyl-CoA dehydrogenase [Kitasatospora sp. GAS204B]
MTDLLGRADPTADDAHAARAARRTVLRARLAEIEEGFGDPWDRNNPVGFSALLAADDEGELSVEGVKRYAQLGLNAEFVPAELGGRLVGLDGLGLLMRPMFRRDVTLAMGTALTSFMGSMVVWLNGDAAQCRRTAETLLNGGLATVAFQQLAHGNDFVNDEFRAKRTAAGLAIAGRKAAVNNAETADLLIAFARSGADNAERDDAEGEGGESGTHSLLLVPMAELPAERVRRLGRHRTDAVRGLRICGLEFADAPLADDALLGQWGRGVELGLRAFPVIHATVPAMCVGLADTALRTATRFAVDQRAFSRPVTEVPMARNALAGTFVDLLICDSLTLTATRALHLIPEQSNVLSAVGKYLVPKLAGEALYHLSVVMGDAFHARNGDHAIFQKHVRDLAMITFGHVSTAMCQATIAPCLPGIAAAEWTADRAAPGSLFTPYGPVPPIDSDRLASFGGQDGLAAYAAEAARVIAIRAPQELGELLREQSELLVAELAEIRRAALELPDDEHEFAASVRSFPLTDRYALAISAICCLGVQLNADPRHEAFSAQPQWLALALDRLLRRLGRRTPALPPAVEVGLCAEVLRRTAENRSLDLYDLPLA